MTTSTYLCIKVSGFADHMVLPSRASLVEMALKTCPNTQVVLSGCSQGGQLVHNAAELLPAATTAKLMAVTFGDPFSHKPVQGVPAAKTRIFVRFIP